MLTRLPLHLLFVFVDNAAPLAMGVDDHEKIVPPHVQDALDNLLEIHLTSVDTTPKGL